MKLPLVAVCVILQQYVPFTYSVSQCSTDQYVGVKYAPIDLDTSDATEVLTPTSLLFTLGDYERFKITNTGRTVEVTLNQPTTINSVCGGILGTKLYLFYKIRFFWDHDYDGKASYSVDRAEYPLSAELIYYNQVYGSFANAVGKPQGVVVVQGGANVEGEVPNTNFLPFQSLLTKIVKAGAECDINGSIRKVVYAWFDQDTVNYPFYYSYQGSYSDDLETDAIQTYDATYIVGPKCVTAFLSICQFAAFTNLLNYAGSPISVLQSAYPSRGRNITQSPGIAEIIRPTSY